MNRPFWPNEETVRARKWARKLHSEEGVGFSGFLSGPRLRKEKAGQNLWPRPAFPSFFRAGPGHKRLGQKPGQKPGQIGEASVELEKNAFDNSLGEWKP
jgi:hypothetical protein